MAENKTAYEDSSTATTPQQKGQQQSHIKKVLNNINNKFSTTISSSSSSPPKMNTTTMTTSTSNNSSSGGGGGGTTIKTHALKHSSSGGSGIINSGQNRGNNMITSDNKHHYHHHHHHHHHNNPYVIHKTTSESLRLSTDLLNSGNNSTNNLSSSSSSSSTNNINNNMNMSTGNMTVHQLHLSTAPLSANIRKPKVSSFQITSVTVGNNKLSADNGDDSADDLDESHTDDNSRVTDIENETPSCSEDTFSKEDVFFSSNALGTAPVIPTSSQYGLVIVDPELGGVGGCTSGQNIQNVHVSVMDAGINIVGPGSKLGDVDQKELQHRNERFKVVKIESTEPFKRGRWVCMDYLDHTTLQQRNNENNTNNDKIDSNGDDNICGSGGGNGAGTSETALTNDSGVNVSENHIDSVGESSDGNNTQQINFHNSPGQTMQHPITIPTISSNPNGSGGAGSAGGPNEMQNLNGISNIQQSIHGQNLTHVPNVVSSQPSLMMSATSGNIQQQQQQHNMNVVGQMTGSIQQQIPSVNENNLPQLNTDTTNYVPGQSQPQIYINQQHQQQQNNVQQVHGATLPANMQMQNGVPNLISSQQQQQSQSSLPQQVISSINVSMPVPSSNNNITNVETHNVNMPSIQPIIMQQQQQTIQHPQSINQQQQQQQPTNNQAVQNQPSQDIFVQSQQSSAPQSYSGNSVTTNLIASGVIQQQQDIQQQIDNQQQQQQQQQQQLNINNQQALQSGIGSPSSLGGMTSNIDAIQQQTNNIAGQSLPNVIIPDINASQLSAPATINEAAVIISNSIQAQQQTHGQTQQSGGSEDNSQQSSQPMETDSERVSRLTLTLSKNKNHLITTNSMITSSSATILTSVASSDIAKQENRYNNNTFTNLALGHSMNRILGSSNKFKQQHNSIRDKSNIDNISMVMNENIGGGGGGIDIPIRRQKTNNIQAIAYSSSPIKPPENISSFYYGYSPNLTSDQTAINYEFPKNDISSSQMNSERVSSINLKARRASSAIGSASGASAVAIDNKIEQAMDLVKSHLMIAVREEVEVLKEKIAELMDRINQLEVENTILKANVSQETLSQLQLQGSVQSGQTTTTQTTNTTSTAPTTTMTNTSNGLVP